MSLFNKIDQGMILDTFKQLHDGADHEIFLSDITQTRTMRTFHKNVLDC